MLVGSGLWPKCPSTSCPLVDTPMFLVVPADAGTYAPQPLAFHPPADASFPIKVVDMGPCFRRADHVFAMTHLHLPATQIAPEFLPVTTP